ncbi:unnamed protein product [Citrullus colocynthis]|uniref:Uncharacterized protein n=1 Tax=Citrullus colocynthis TaxID=252529 RepID=A0ABP0YAI8_9ROSI
MEIVVLYLLFIGTEKHALNFKILFISTWPDNTTQDREADVAEWDFQFPINNNNQYKKKRKENNFGSLKISYKAAWRFIAQRMSVEGRVIKLGEQIFAIFEVISLLYVLNAVRFGAL